MRVTEAYLQEFCLRPVVAEGSARDKDFGHETGKTFAFTHFETKTAAYPDPRSCRN